MMLGMQALFAALAVWFSLGHSERLQFDTTHGPMTLEVAITGKYDLASGAIGGGTFRGNAQNWIVWSSFWSEGGSGRCASTGGPPQAPTNNWGKIEFVFSPDSKGEYKAFTGKWARCDEIPNRDWSGTYRSSSAETIVFDSSFGLLEISGSAKGSFGSNGGAVGGHPDVRKQGPPQAPAFKWGRINVVFIRNPNGDFSTFAGMRDSCSGNLDSEWKGIPPGTAPNPPSPTEEPKPPAPSQGPKTSPDPTPPATTADPLPPSTIIYTAGSNILGAASAAAAIGNPLKGLCTSPNWASKPAPGVPATLDYYYIRFDALMKGPNTFDWGLLEQQIARAKSNQRHVVWSVYTHYPGRELALPGFLSGKVPIIGGQPLYDDPDLIAAMETFIAKWAEEYDGHKSVAFIQLGLLGKWGEWHTYPEKGLLSDRTKDIIAAAFTRGFKTTKLLQRYPRESTNDGPIGYIDHSFTYNTLDGAANGGDEVSWHFWPRLLKNGQGDFWRTRVMGGETRPENQKEVFTPGYRRRTKNKQDFMECVRTTHTTYMVHGNAFSGSGYTGQTLANARQAHAEMGYNFQVTKVAVMANARVDVTVKQVGVAPFYYPLNLELSCNGFTQQVNGVEKIIVENDEKTFSFSGLLRSATCRNQVSIKLRSPFVQPGKAIKFAQMNGTVTLKVPV